jgi:hypothetical protein
MTTCWNHRRNLWGAFLERAAAWRQYACVSKQANDRMASKPTMAATEWR